jgi:outer membrane protein TolC
MFVPLAGFCQKQISEDEALSLTLKNSAVLNASSLEVIQSRQLQKTAYNFDNPEIMMESPTGEFQTLGVTQSLAFPTVYIKQFQLSKEQTALAKTGQKITENDLKYQIRSLYLSLQYAELLFKQYSLQDSIFKQINVSAQRQFEAGQIDFLEKTVAETQYGEIHNQMVQAEADLQVLRVQLQTYTGLKEPVTAVALKKAEAAINISIVKNDSSAIQNNPSFLYSKQQQTIGRKTLSLERNKFLPGFTFGYLNQAARSTPIDMRFRAGVNIPLWFWQYTGSISAAKTGLKISEQRLLAKQQSLSLEMQRAQGDFLKYDQALKYYETTGLKQTDAIISASTRFFESGERDYVSYLRNLNEAYLIKLRYAETLKNYNQSLLIINYLSGNL